MGKMCIRDRLYTLLIAGGALTVLMLPDSQLIPFAIYSQVLNGVLLPVVIILMLMLINRKDLMLSLIHI